MFNIKISIGQIFHTKTSEIIDINSNISDYQILTKGSYEKGANIYKGIWGYKAIKEPDNSFSRRPAIILLSNSYKEDSENNPWVDVMDPDKGVVVYNGDNRYSAKSATASHGNKLLMDIYELYTDPSKRIYAPPILIFSQYLHDGNVTGYRQFIGFGVPTNLYIRTQKEKGSANYFTNLVIEIALLGLEKENEFFDWNWIDKRRDSNLSSVETLKFAPSTWKQWVNSGNKSIENIRRKVSKYKISKRTEQLDYSIQDAEILNTIINYYEKINRHPFEGFASFITQKVIGGNFVRGWVTKRSGDGGVDFISRLDLGSDFSTTSVVILGQAKCVNRTSCSNGKDIARVVARLQRGWIGAFVTTGWFSENAQQEIYDDGYPIVLINGKRIASEIRLIMNSTGMKLSEILESETNWYNNNMQPLDPSRILDIDYPLTKFY